MAVKQSLVAVQKSLRLKDRAYVLGISVVIGLFCGLFLSAFNITGIRLSVAERFINGMLIGTLIPSMYLLFSIEILRRPYFRKKPYLYLVISSFFALVLITLFVHLLVGSVSFRDQVLSTQGLLTSIVMSLILASFTTVVETIRRFSGKSVVTKVLLGTYHQARQEDVVILFIDLKSSTTLAESLGTDRFFDFINEFHSIVEDFVRFNDGTIYKYLGDGQIVIWPIQKVDSATKMVLDLSSGLSVLQERINRDYGHTMQFTAGLHCGPVLVGEIGIERREIGYWGNTMNTAQRIQSACRDYGATFLLSENLVSQLSSVTQQTSKFKLIENVQLRGLKTHINLYKAL